MTKKKNSKQALKSLPVEKNFIKLLNIIHTLCGEKGCAWDKKQSHSSLKKYLIEEAYEVLEAIDNKDQETLQEELGDLLYQILFHCELAQKENKFDINGVILSISEKMLRRHPHVFGQVKIKAVKDILDNWDKIKKAEKGKEKRASITDGIPLALPALQKAQKLQKKIAKVGFDWDSVEGVIEKIDEELEEVKEAISQQNEQKISEEIGDLMFSVVNLSRYVGKEAEYLLHDAIKKFTARFKKVEKELKREQKTFTDSTLAEMETLWNKVKKTKSQ